MNIVIVGPLPPPFGGMAMQSRQLATLLAKQGHDITFVPVNPAYKPEFVGRLPVVRALFRFWPYLFSLWGTIKNKDVVHVMANSGKAFFLFVWPAVYIAKCLKVPVVINYRGGNAKPFFEQSWSKVKNCFAQSRSLVVPSGFLKQVFASYGQPAEIIPNIIDLNRFEFVEPSIADIEEPVLAVTRNLEKIYDIGTAIKAFQIIQRSYPKARLIVAGSGEEESHLKQLTSTLQLDQSVQFVGKLDRAEVIELYAKADVMLNPSVVDNMPNSILEALSSGVLVVSSNVGGIPFMVTHQQEAILVQPENPEAMAEAVIQLLDNPAEAKRLAVNGLQRIRDYRPEKVIPLWEAIYRQAMHK